MAQFNPSPGQVQDPNYWYWSKAIQQPESDKSGQYALHGAGQAIEGGLKGADEVVKTELDSQIHEKVDTERQQYSDALVLAENQLNSRGNVQGGNTGGQGEVPDDVKRMPSAVSALQGARANGRISETYYYSRLDALAKDFRSRFPGYRDYIDQKISTITGVTPANAYIKSLIGDINAAQSNGQKEYERVQTELEKASNAGAPDGPRQLEMLRATGASGINAANRWMNEQNARTYAIKRHQDERSDKDATAADRKTAADGESDLVLNGMFTEHWNKVAGNYGINSAKDMDDVIKRAAAGQLNIKPDDLEGIGMQLHVSEAQMKQDAIRRFTQIDPKTGRSLMTDIGGPTVMNEKVNAFLSNWRTTADLITHDKLGLATASKRISEEMVSTAKTGFLTNKDFGRWMTNLDALNQISPKYAETYFQGLVANPDFEKGLKNYLAVNSSDLMSQDSYTKNGIVSTFKKKFEDLQAKGIKMPQAYDQYLKLMETVADPKAEPGLKKSIAQGAFDPANIGMINQTFKEDSVVAGRSIPGRISVFNRLGTDDYVKGMKTINDPKSWNDYVSFMGKSYSDLLQPEIQGLNKIQGSKYVYMTWDNKEHQWGLHQVGDPTGKNILMQQSVVPRMDHIRAMGDAATDQLMQYKASINKLNSFTRTLARVVEADGGKDANVDILQHMINTGLDPTIANPQGIPDQIVKSIIQSREAAKVPSKYFDKGKDLPAVAPLQ